MIKIDYIKMKIKTCYICKKEYISTGRNQKYCILCSDKVQKEKYKKWIIINKKRFQEIKRKWQLKNKIKIYEWHRQWRLKNRKNLNIRSRKFYQKNKIKIIKKGMEYRKKRLKTDLNYKIKHYLRSRLISALKGNPKLSTTMNLVGCSIDKLKHYLESKFKKGMTWSNYGKWHVDHIRPCCSFDLSKPSEQRKCFHYTNLQPLWAKENLSKKDKF